MSRPSSKDPSTADAGTRTLSKRVVAWSVGIVNAYPNDLMVIPVVARGAIKAVMPRGDLDPLEPRVRPRIMSRSAHPSATSCSRQSVAFTFIRKHALNGACVHMYSVTTMMGVRQTESHPKFAHETCRYKLGPLLSLARLTPPPYTGCDAI
ncbi:hypothetical protein ANO14919_029580 [Xylariales sp. No.14919]|nr:hypothetical protein ANO14919_029580 [Xylariales sp. No.14919]